MRVVLWLALALLAAIVQAQPPAPVSFAIVGDAPYNGLEEIVFRQMLEEINQEDLAFVVHVGDFKSGGSNTAGASKKTEEKQTDSSSKSETADTAKSEKPKAEATAAPATPAASSNTTGS